MGVLLPLLSLFVAGTLAPASSTSVHPIVTLPASLSTTACSTPAQPLCGLQATTLAALPDGSLATAFFDARVSSLGGVTYAVQTGGSGAWTEATIVPPRADTAIGAFVSMAVVVNHPAVVYSVQRRATASSSPPIASDATGVEYARATCATGLCAWEVFIIDGDTGGLPGAHLRLAVVDGAPAFVTVSGSGAADTSRTVRFARSHTSSQGIIQPWPAAALTDSGHGAWTCDVGDLPSANPIVAYHNRVTGAAMYAVSLTTTGSGSTLSGNWQHAVVNRMVGVDLPAVVSLGVTGDGFPAVAYTDLIAGAVGYAESRHDLGINSWADSQVLVAPPGGHYTHVSLEFSASGVPTMAVVDDNGAGFVLWQTSPSVVDLVTNTLASTWEVAPFGADTSVGAVSTLVVGSLLLASFWDGDDTTIKLATTTIPDFPTPSPSQSFWASAAGVAVIILVVLVLAAAAVVAFVMWKRKHAVKPLAARSPSMEDLMIKLDTTTARMDELWADNEALFSEAERLRGVVETQAGDLETVHARLADARAHQDVDRARRAGALSTVNHLVKQGGHDTLANLARYVKGLRRQVLPGVGAYAQRRPAYAINLVPPLRAAGVQLAAAASLESGDSTWLHVDHPGTTWDLGVDVQLDPDEEPLAGDCTSVLATSALEARVGSLRSVVEATLGTSVAAIPLTLYTLREDGRPRPTPVLGNAACLPVVHHFMLPGDGDPETAVGSPTACFFVPRPWVTLGEVVATVRSGGAIPPGLLTAGGLALPPPCGGEPLNTMVGGLPESSWVLVATQVLHAVAHFHSLFLAHRNLTPDTVFVAAGDRLLVGGYDAMDFVTAGGTAAMGADVRAVGRMVCSLMAGMAVSTPPPGANWSQPVSVFFESLCSPAPPDALSAWRTASMLLFGPPLSSCAALATGVAATERFIVPTLVDVASQLVAVASAPRGPAAGVQAGLPAPQPHALTVRDEALVDFASDLSPGSVVATLDWLTAALGLVHNEPDVVQRPLPKVAPSVDLKDLPTELRWKNKRRERLQRRAKLEPGWTPAHTHPPSVQISEA